MPQTCVYCPAPASPEAWPPACEVCRAAPLSTPQSRLGQALRLGLPLRDGVVLAVTDFPGEDYGARYAGARLVTLGFQKPAAPEWPGWSWFGVFWALVSFSDVRLYIECTQPKRSTTPEVRTHAVPTGASWREVQRREKLALDLFLITRRPGAEAADAAQRRDQHAKAKKALDLKARYGDSLPLRTIARAHIGCSEATLKRWIKDYQGRGGWQVRLTKAGGFREPPEP